MHEFDVLQRPFLLRHHDDAGAMRQAGERRRRLFERLRQALAARRAQRLDVVALVLGEVAEFEQTVTKNRNPASVGSRPAEVCGE